MPEVEVADLHEHANLPPLFEFVSGSRFFDIKDIRKRVRAATITIETPNFAEANDWTAAIENFRLGNIKHDELPPRIVSCVLAMKDLHTLSLNLAGVSRELEPKLVVALQARQKWKIASLRIIAPCSNLPKSIIRHCKKGTLESLHIYTGIPSPGFKTAAKHHPGLKRLHLSMLFFRNTSVFIPSMGFGTLGIISEKFPDLEWLVLGERKGLRIFAPDACSAVQYRDTQAKFVRGLLRFTKLKRVAFTVFKEGLGRKLIEGDDNHNGQPEELTIIELDRWCSKVICELAIACPNLEEICVMVEFPEFYRGTRGREGQAMVVRHQNAYEVSPKDGFPVGLMERDAI